ncbi:energy transducer TonB [Rhodohalobacter sp. 8-1]|uniref:energy transducer TonB n=1 Tax=Rhodohalobacter sp. 8-1 TaxID=3131972 RepID=UPI0030ED4785
MERKNKNRKFRTNRDPKVDLRKYYTIFFEVGLIITLMVFIGLTRMNFVPSDEQDFVLQTQDVVEMEEIIQTKQREMVPPPPRPPVPVAVPNDVIIEDVDIDINAELDLSADGYLPPPPKSKEEEVEDEPEQDFFIAVEKMPEIIGGMKGIQERIQYPELAVKANIQGRVYVQFIVNENGEVEDPVVLRGIGGGCDQEAVRVIKETKFSPGMQRGRPVRVRYSLPIIFMLR